MKHLQYIAFALLLTACSSGTIGTDGASAVPTSGQWNFSMNASVQNLSGPNCPTSGAATLNTQGVAQLTASADGLSVTLNIDGQTLSYARSSLSDAVYETASQPFPTRDANDNVVMGSVVFDLHAFDPSDIVGTLHWNNNQGCTGTYSYEMELL